MGLQNPCTVHLCSSHPPTYSACTTRCTQWASSTKEVPKHDATVSAKCQKATVCFASIGRTAVLYDPQFSNQDSPPIACRSASALMNQACEVLLYPSSMIPMHDATDCPSAIAFASFS